MWNNRVYRWVLGAAALFVLAAPAAAQKVYVDYDHDAKFGDFKTYQYVASKNSMAQKSPLMDQRVVQAIETQLNDSGLSKTDEGAQLTVTYHVTSKQSEQIDTTGFGGVGMGWGAGWADGGAGWGDSTSTVSTYTTGTLIVEIYDAETKTTIWRGTASSIVPENPQKGAQKIENAIAKMAEKWHSMRSKK